jgi:hypothetical protein
LRVEGRDTSRKKLGYIFLPFDKLIYLPASTGLVPVAAPQQLPAKLHQAQPFLLHITA